MQKFKRRSFLLLSLAHSSNEIYWVLIPLLLPLVREELNFTYTQAGLLLTCFFAVLSIFSVLSGHLGDLHGSRKILAFGFLLTTVTFPLLFFVSSYFQIIAVLAIIAIGVSVFHPVGTALISQGWQRGLSFGFFEATGFVGALIGTILFGSLVGFLGWRLTSLILVVPSLAVGLAFLISRRNLEYTSSKTRPKNSLVGLKSLTLFYFVRATQIFGGVAILSFMPLFAVDVGGLLPEKASLFPIFIWVGGVPGTLVCATFSDYYSPLKIIFFLILTIIPAIFVVTLSLPVLVIFLFLVLFGFCHCGAWASQGVWLSRVTYEKTRGKIFGGTMVLAGLARVFSPFLFGLLADKWGLIITFRCATISIIIGAVYLFKLIRKVNQVRESYS